MDRTYLCIDLKSFYASVECVERGLDPMTTNLVVADPERIDKTICLAVSPSLRALGVPGRACVFEIPAGVGYVMAPPRIAKCIERSAEVYAVYLRHFAPGDIRVYSIDEAFVDVAGYLALYGCTARELGERVRREVRREVLDEAGIPATCGIGPNLYLAREMCDASCLDLVERRSTAESGTLAVRYEKDEWGSIGSDGGIVRLPGPTNFRDVVMPLLVGLFEDVADRNLAVHNIMLNFNGVAPETERQPTLFLWYSAAIDATYIKRDCPFL